MEQWLKERKRLVVSTGGFKPQQTTVFIPRPLKQKKSNPINLIVPMVS